jgi:hypothetical protein
VKSHFLLLAFNFPEHGFLFAVKKLIDGSDGLLPCLFDIFLEGSSLGMYEFRNFFLELKKQGTMRFF